MCIKSIIRLWHQTLCLFVPFANVNKCDFIEHLIVYLQRLPCVAVRRLFYSLFQYDVTNKMCIHWGNKSSFSRVAYHWNGVLKTLTYAYLKNKLKISSSLHNKILCVSVNVLHIVVNVRLMTRPNPGWGYVNA